MHVRVRAHVLRVRDSVGMRGAARRSFTRSKKGADKLYNVLYKGLHKELDMEPYRELCRAL